MYERSSGLYLFISMHKAEWRRLNMVQQLKTLQCGFLARSPINYSEENGLKKKKKNGSRTKMPYRCREKYLYGSELKTSLPEIIPDLF